MMKQFRSDEKRAHAEEGFTLIELLVVIIILGILAAVVVFAVGGVGDKGQSSACKIDTRTIRTAEEAFFAQGGLYTREGDLIPDFLTESSVLHDIAGYTTAADKVAGTPNSALEFAFYDITVSAEGATKCVPAGAQGSDCPGGTPASAGTVVGSCTLAGSSPPVRYPF